MPDLDTFELEFENDIVVFKFSTLALSWKNKNAWIWEQKCLICVFLG